MQPENEDLGDANWLHLTEGEQIQWSGRPAWVTVAPAIAVGIVIAIVGIVLSVWLSGTSFVDSAPSWVVYLPLVVSLFGIAQAVVAHLKWARLLYVITDEEIYVKRGFVSRDVTQIRLDRIQNTAYDQSVLERMLSFGDVRVYTAGTSTEDITFRDVPNPEHVKSILTQLLSDQQRSGNRENPLSP